MPFPLAIPFALSAIQSLIKFRGRLDTILSLNETTANLPFALPPAPADIEPHIQPMLDFFGTPNGEAILELRGQRPDFDIVFPNPKAPAVQGPRKRLLELYFQSAEVRPTSLGPPTPDFAHAGPSTEMRLAYFVVESHRLARNPAVTRVLLATADTLLEVAGANASLFIADPRTRGLVETVLNEFAGQRDWDDASGAQIFKTLLGAAAVAAIDHRRELTTQPALTALLAALADVRKEMDAAGNNTSGTDFVAGFISFAGFQRLFSQFLTHAADTPELLPDNAALRASITAMLREAAAHPLATLRDPKILANVLQTGLVEATAALGDLAAQKLGNQPLLAAVLKSVADAIQSAAAQRALFRQIASGEMLTTIYQASLRSLAANPKLLTQAGLNDFTAKLVVTLANELSRKAITSVLKPETLQTLAVRGIGVLAGEPEFLAGNNAFAAKLLGATLEATAGAIKDGLSPDDFAALTRVAVKTAVSNVSLVKMDERLRPVIVAFGGTLSEASLAGLTNATGRKELFCTALETLAANPQIWNGLAQKDLAQPLVFAVLKGLATDPTQLLTGPALVPTFAAVLRAAARRAQPLLTGNIPPAALQKLLQLSLARANAAIGQTIDGETLPFFLRRVVDEFLRAPIDLANDNLLNDWLAARLKEVDVALPKIPI